MIKVNTFVQVRNKKLKDNGIEYGSIVYVASMTPFPISKSDQYTLRVKLFVHKLGEDGVIDTKSGLYIIDPRSVKELSEGDNQFYMDKAQAYFLPIDNGDGEAIPV